MTVHCNVEISLVWIMQRGRCRSFTKPPHSIIQLDKRPQYRTNIYPQASAPSHRVSHGRECTIAAPTVDCPLRSVRGQEKAFADYADFLQFQAPSDDAASKFSSSNTTLISTVLSRKEPQMCTSTCRACYTLRLTLTTP